MAASSFLVITVEYGNRHDTLHLIESLEKTAGDAPIELVVVDNSHQRDEHLSAAETTLEGSRRIRARRLKTPENLFYWGGANFALHEVGVLAPVEPGWVIVCNNDIVFSDEAFFTRLAALEPLSAAVIAPCIISSVTGRDQNPLLRKPPGVLTRARWMLYDSGYPVARLLLALRPVWTTASNLLGRAQKSRTQHEAIFAPHGACVIFSSEFFTRGGRLDTTVPLFAEELTLAADASRLRLPIRHVPELRVTHREHSTTGTRLTPFKYDLERRARRRFYEIESAKS